MKTQIKALYKIATYLDDKLPNHGEFRYAALMNDPFLVMNNILPDMSTLIKRGIEKYVKNTDLETYFSYDEHKLQLHIHVTNTLLVWDCIFPDKSTLPSKAPIVWFIEQLREQLFPRILKGL